MKKFAFYTLGCKLNFAESSHLSKILIDNGFNVVENNETADVCIINTCSVTDIADKKCRQAINKLSAMHPNSFVIVTGCYAQISPDEIAKIEGVDLILGTKEKFDILKILQNISAKEELKRIQVQSVKQNNDFEPIFSSDDRTRRFLKIQDGCDYYCSYCTIPFARGKSRSSSVTKTLEVIKKAIAGGAKEIILTGVNIGDFGKRTNEKLIDLIKEIDKITENVRIRLSSIEPDLLDDEIIELVSKSKIFAPHFHIPLQSGSNRVLALMKRKYTRELFFEKVTKIKTLIPDAFIGVDVIAGMNGETEELFLETLSFLEKTPFSELHIFPYSERKGTKALEIQPIVSKKNKKNRRKILYELSEKHLADFYESQKGKNKTVLWETAKNPKIMTGYTENYLTVSAPFEKEKINTFQKVEIYNFNPNFN